MNEKLKIYIALSVFIISSVLEIIVPFPRDKIVYLMMIVDVIGAISVFYILVAMPISKPSPPDWLPFLLALIPFSLLIAPFYIEIEFVSKLLNNLNMVFMIMVYGIGIFGFHTMYVKFKSKKQTD
jgi:hypothetical protein